MLLRLERLLLPARAEARAEALAREAPLVVMGRGKSGTRLLAFACHHLGLAMGTSGGLGTGDIAHAGFRNAVKALALQHFAAEADAVPPEALQRFQAAAARMLPWLRRHEDAGAGWGWKWPETYLIAPIVHAAFPRARFVHLVRDGREIAFNRHLTDDPRRPLGRRLLRHIGALEAPRHLQAARSWQFQVERYRAYAEAHIPAEQRLELTYEALCRDPAGQMARVAALVGVPMTEACRAFVTGSLTVEHLGRYRTRDPRLVAEVEAAIGGTLQALGYPLSTAGGEVPTGDAADEAAAGERP